MSPGSLPSAAARRDSPVYLVIQLVGGAASALLLAYFLSFGTMESRLTYLLVFVLGFLNPLWALYGLALLGPLSLLDQSKGHILAVMEIFPLGIIAGEIWRLRRPAPPPGDGFEDLGRLGQLPPLRPGPWPGLLAGLFLILLSSSLIGCQLILLKQYAAPPPVPGWLDRMNAIFYGAATQPDWALKSLWNWGSGIAVAVILARRATPVAIARFLKLGAIGLAAACGFALLNYAGAIELTHIRAPNPDPLQRGRLQGPAGHPGWFAQWIVIYWPGIFLWWEGGRRKRNTLLLAAAAVILASLFLAAARAAWLGAGLAAAIGAIYTVRRDPSMRRPILIAAGVMAGAALLTGFVAGEAIAGRMSHLLHAQDRANYYVSTLFFLREFPLGLGLGLHGTFYDWILTPFYRWAQSDHVTAHSLWLHTLAENGPIVPAVLAALVFLATHDFRRGWRRAGAEERPILLAAGLALLGLLVVSAAQYILYIRAVELAAWSLGGCLIGWMRRGGGSPEERESWWSPRILLLLGLLAVFSATFQSRRMHGDTFPPYMERNREEGTLQFWTGADWWTPVSSDVDTIRFTVYRGPVPGTLRIDWPDGSREEVQLAAEESRSFEFRQEASPASWLDNPGRLRLRVSPIWTPARFLEGAEDQRQLGVYLSGFRFESVLREQEGLPLLRF